MKFYIEIEFKDGLFSTYKLKKIINLAMEEFINLKINLPETAQICQPTKI